MAASPQAVLLPTALGDARAFVHRVPGRRRALATLVLGHGAGRGADTRDLLDLAEHLPGQRIVVIRVDQPWVVAGGRVAPAPVRLDLAWSEIVPRLPIAGSLLLGGRSAGARVACRTAAALGARGVLALAFPLHPPGRPDRGRAGELAGVDGLLVLQGERDASGRPAQFPDAVPVLGVPGADHSLRAGLGEDLLAAVTSWGIRIATAGVVTAGRSSASARSEPRP